MISHDAAYESRAFDTTPFAPDPRALASTVTRDSCPFNAALYTLPYIGRH